MNIIDKIDDVLTEARRLLEKERLKENSSALQVSEHKKVDV